MEIISIISISIMAFVVAVFASMVGGAGLIMVPVLVFFGVTPQTAIGTNWVADGFMNLASSVRYYKDKHLKLKKILFFSIVAGFSGLIGISILLNINENAISKIISIIIILMSAFLLIKNNIGIKKKQIKGNILLTTVIAIALGVYGGFFGGGLGSLLMFSFIFLFGFDFIASAANARFSEFIMSIVIVTGFIVSGLIDKQVVVPYTVASALGGWFGASIATKIGNVWIKRLFILVAIAMGIKLWIS